FAFKATYGPTNVAIPSSVTNIGVAPFYYCTTLQTISVDVNNLYYSSEGGVLFDKNQSTLIQYPISKIGSYSIPIGVTTLSDFAFEYCIYLSRVDIPIAVTNIGVSALDGCVMLETIAVDPDNPAYTSASGVLFDKEQTTLIQYPAGNPTGSYTIP